VADIAGRMRAMFDDDGQPVKSAPPATPVVVLGLPRVPAAGDTFQVVKDEKTSRGIAAERAAARQQAGQAPAKALSLEEVYSQAQSGATKELNLILKVDVHGSLDPIITSLQRLGDESLKISMIHEGTGDITESDIMLAIASRAVIIGFNVSVAPAAQRMAQTEGVDVRVYDIIYRLVDDVEKALQGLLEPVYEDVTVGRAVVRASFRIPNRGVIAGVQITEGKALRGAQVRVLRAGELLFDGKIASLKRFKDDVREVGTGLECGVGVEGYNEFAEGDTLEFYAKEKVS
jgi:translation initiation factor IF-2